MKKQVKEQIEKMVAKMNEELKEFDLKTEYNVETGSFDREEYRVDIYFNATFHGDDLFRIINVVNANNLHMHMAHLNAEWSYIHLQ